MQADLPGVPRASDILDGIPIWAPATELGVAWGAQAGDGWDIVAFVRRPSDLSVWAAERGGVGSGLVTGSSEPDWDVDPEAGVTDGDYKWFPVAPSWPERVGYTAGLPLTPCKLISRAGYVWASYPTVAGSATGLTEAAFRDAVPPTQSTVLANYVTDGPGYWWPVGKA